MTQLPTKDFIDEANLRHAASTLVDGMEGQTAGPRSEAVMQERQLQDSLFAIERDPLTHLNAMAQRQTQATESDSIRLGRDAAQQLLRSGVQNVADPEVNRLARDFILNHPAEYRALKESMRSGGQMFGYEPQAAAPPMTMDEAANAVNAFETRDAGVRRRQDAAADAVDAFETRDADIGTRQNAERAARRFDMLPDAERQMYISATGSYEKGAEAYMETLRRQRGVDRETRQAAKTQQRLALAARDILRRNAGNPDALNRAMQNYNSRNPEMPLRPEDLGLPSGDSGVVARPGDIVEADSLASLNPNKVGIGAIISTPEGLSEIRSIGGGKKGGVPVLQDSNSGFFFVDPDATLSDRVTPAYPDMESYNKALTRNDRIKFRRAILNSGNSIYAVEQRRLDAARDIASKHVIDEVRKAGLEEVARQEAEFHYRYITEEAALTGMSTGQRAIEEIPDRQQGGRGQTFKQPTWGDVKEFADELRSQPMSPYRDWDDASLMDEAYRQIMQQQTPYEYRQMQGGGATGVEPEAARPSEATTAGPSVPAEDVNTNTIVSDTATQDTVIEGLEREYREELNRASQQVSDFVNATGEVADRNRRAKYGIEVFNAAYAGLPSLLRDKYREDLRLAWTRAYNASNGKMMPFDKPDRESAATSPNIATATNAAITGRN